MLIAHYVFLSMLTSLVYLAWSAGYDIHDDRSFIERARFKEDDSKSVQVVAEIYSISCVVSLVGNVVISFVIGSNIVSSIATSFSVFSLIGFDEYTKKMLGYAGAMPHTVKVVASNYICECRDRIASVVFLFIAIQFISMVWFS